MILCNTRNTRNTVYQGIPRAPLVLLLQRSEVDHALGFGSITGGPAHVVWHGAGSPCDRASGKVPSLMNYF
jgi:hypothetical protein